MQVLSPKIVATADGSHSIYLANLDETYHSHHGALQESQYVYINRGLEYLAQLGQQAFKVFELGFGTGLNVFLTMAYAEMNKIPIYLESIEKHPIVPEVLKQLNYKHLVPLLSFEEYIDRIIDCSWNTQEIISPYFTLRKTMTDFLEMKPSESIYDIIFYDAFGFRAQREMWSAGAFETCYNLLRSHGVLVTYASQGIARRNMESVGFRVDRLPGAPGKREMMRAIKLRK